MLKTSNRMQKRGKADEQTAKAVEMRKSSMETFTQSKKRKGEQEQKKSKRSIGTETVAYLREKAQLDASLKREELQLRRGELEKRKSSKRVLWHNRGVLQRCSVKTLKANRNNRSICFSKCNCRIQLC